MSFRWNTLFQLGCDIFNGHEDSDIPEAHLRTAVGRFYYGTKGVAREYLRSKGYPLGDLENHWNTINIFKHHRNMDMKKIGRALGNLMTERIHADYHGDENFDIDRVETARNKAERTLSLLKTLR